MLKRSGDLLSLKQAVAVGAAGGGGPGQGPVWPHAQLQAPTSPGGPPAARLHPDWRGGCRGAGWSRLGAFP